MRALTTLLLLVFGLCLATRAQAEDHPSLGSKQCQNCHQAIYEHEKSSRHWLSFKEFAKGAGEAIATKAGVAKPTEVGTRCVECHGHTYLNDKGKNKVEPTSCEACHGKAGDYLTPHNVKYDAAKNGADQAAFLAKRRADSVAAGMTAQWRLNGGYRNCFNCHVGTDEAIVNGAGHPVMKEFELLAFSQGTTRHWHGEAMKQDGTGRQGAIHVTGQALTLQKALAAVGLSKDAGAYRTEYFAMAKAAGARLGELAALLPDRAELKALVDAAAPLATLTGDDAGKCADLAKALDPLVVALLDKLDDAPLADDVGAKLIPANMPVK